MHALFMKSLFILMSALVVFQSLNVNAGYLSKEEIVAVEAELGYLPRYLGYAFEKHAVVGMPENLHENEFYQEGLVTLQKLTKLGLKSGDIEDGGILVFIGNLLRLSDPLLRSCYLDFLVKFGAKLLDDGELEIADLTDKLETVTVDEIQIYSSNFILGEIGAVPAKVKVNPKLVSDSRIKVLNRLTKYLSKQSNPSTILDSAYSNLSFSNEIAKIIAEIRFESFKILPEFTHIVDVDNRSKNLQGDALGERRNQLATWSKVKFQKELGFIASLPYQKYRATAEIPNALKTVSGSNMKIAFITEGQFSYEPSKYMNAQFLIDQVQEKLNADSGLAVREKIISFLRDSGNDILIDKYFDTSNNTLRSEGVRAILYFGSYLK
jgi:hypothetical protein